LKEWAGASSWPGAKTNLSSKNLSWLDFVNSQKSPCRTPIFTKFCEVAEQVKRNNFTFGVKFKFQMDVELQFQEANKI
jgi:hypothetical protein